MLSKKILSILLAASALTPLTAAVVENIDPECVEAATEFVEPYETFIIEHTTVPCLYGAGPSYHEESITFYVGKGDVNLDGKLDMDDYALLKKYIKTDGEVDINKTNADINGDDKIDTKDLDALRDRI